MSPRPRVYKTEAIVLPEGSGVVSVPGESSPMISPTASAAWRTEGKAASNVSVRSGSGRERGA